MRLHNKYTADNPPLQCFLTNSKWYKQSGGFTPKGILLHDTGADNDMLRRYVQPSDSDPNYTALMELLGKNKYGNDWNHGSKDKDAGVNAFIGRCDDGKVTTMQTGPWNKRPWGCGSGKKGSLNDTHIQWEICEDAKKDKDYFADVYEESIQLCAYLCKLYKIDPCGTITYKGISVPAIVCHWDSYNLGCGSGHGDIYDWTAMYDYLGIPKKSVNINDPYNNAINKRIRDDIAKAMEDGPVKNGWSRADGKWYYYDNGNLIKSDWVKWKGSWYYMGTDGAMVTDFQTIDGKIYHFAESGEMAQGEWYGKYFADMSGACSDRGGEWHEDGAGRWFSDGSGWYPKNRTVRIDGEDCRFNSKGYLEG